MTLYVIRGDSVTAHSSPPAMISEGELAVQSIGDIEASGLSKAELTARRCSRLTSEPADPLRIDGPLFIETPPFR